MNKLQQIFALALVAYAAAMPVHLENSGTNQIEKLVQNELSRSEETKLLQQKTFSASELQALAAEKDLSCPVGDINSLREAFRNAHLYTDMWQQLDNQIENIDVQGKDENEEVLTFTYMMPRLLWTNLLHSKPSISVKFTPHADSKGFDVVKIGGNVNCLLKPDLFFPSQAEALSDVEFGAVASGAKAVVQSAASIACDHLSLGCTPTPTNVPTHNPSPTPTEPPTANPTHTPTETPTAKPTNEPTAEPTHRPTFAPTEEPTPSPTHTPTEVPTPAPTLTPTDYPSPTPTQEPTRTPNVCSRIRVEDDHVLRWDSHVEVTHLFRSSILGDLLSDMWSHSQSTFNGLCQRYPPPPTPEPSRAPVVDSRRRRSWWGRR